MALGMRPSIPIREAALCTVLDSRVSPRPPAFYPRRESRVALRGFHTTTPSESGT